MEDAINLLENTATESRHNQPSELGSVIAASWQALLRLNISLKSNEALTQATSFISSLGKAVGFIDTMEISKTKLSQSLLCERHVRFSNDILMVMGQIVRIYVTASAHLSIEDYKNLLSVLSEAGIGNRIFFVIVPGKATEAKNAARSEKSGLVVIDSDDITEIVTHAQPTKTFYRLVRQQSPMHLIQPYNHFGAVRSAMFFGRRRELGQILLSSDKSFAIFGGRRTGKSSLLAKLKDDLSGDRLNKPVFFSAEGIKDTTDFSFRLLQSLQGMNIEARALKLRFDLEQFRSHLKNEILIGGKRVTFLIDEIDELVFLDQAKGEPIMHMLRTLNEELRDKCRFVFAGFRRLYDRIIYHYSAAMNFIIPIALGGLDQKSARQLIEVPFCNYMGYDVTSEVFDTILNYSSNSPWQIQNFCGRLVQILEHEQKDTVDKYDVQQVFEDFDFRSDVIETILANLSNEQMVILCTFLESERFTREDVYKAFQREQLPVQIEYLGRQLNQMVKFGVLSPPKKGNNNSFGYAYSHLPIIIKELESPSLLLTQAKSQIKQREKRH